MEADPGKQRSRQKRRERALQLQQEKQTREEEEEASGQDDHDQSPPRSSKDKPPRSKPKKGKSALFEEDIIDGFAIMSFKTLEELEIVTKKNGCTKIKSKSEEDTGTKDNNTLQNNDDNAKVKKKKLKKSSSTNHCIDNCVDSSGNASDSNISTATTNGNTNNNADGGGVDTGNNNISNDISGDVDVVGGGENNSTSNNCRISNNNSSNNADHQNHHQSQHHHHHSNGPLEPPRCISRDRLSDASTYSGSGQGYVCDVESGDDKASESGSDLYTGIPTGGILNHLPSNGHNNPCVALTAPTPPPSTSSTPTPLCNGIGGPATLSPSPVHHVPVACSTTTSTTTTNSTSRPGFSDALTTCTTSAAVTSTAQTSQSVIQPTPYLPDHLGLKSQQYPPGSGHVPNHHQRTLSPNSQQQQPQQNHHSNFIGDSSSCARSLQYSKSLKSNHIPGSTKGVSPHPSTNSKPHHHHPPSETLPPSHLQNGPSNLSHQLPPPHLQQSPQSNYYPYHNQSPGSGYPSPYPNYPTVIRPEPVLNHHAGPLPGAVGNEPKKPDQQCATGGAQSSTTPSTGLPPATAAAPSPLTPAPQSGHHHHHHHSSSGSGSHHHHHSSSSSSHKSSPSPHLHGHHHHHHHNSSSSSRPQSPSSLGYPAKRPCRTPPSGILPPSPASATSSDLTKKFTPPFPPKPSGNRPESIGSSGTSKDHLDRSRPREGSGTSGSHHHPHLHGQYHQNKDHRDRERDREKEREREKERDRAKTPVSLSLSLPSSPFPTPKPTWSSTPGPLYSPLLHPHHPSPLTPSSGLHPLGAGPPPTSSVPPHSSPIFPLPLAPPPLLAAGAPSLSAGMFAPPLHPAPPSLSSAPPLPTHPSASNQFSAESLIRSQDFLHQDLNNRLLAHRDSNTIALPPSPFVRNETHQHQHQHQHLHNHMHQHTYGGLSAAPLAPPLFDKIPKAFEAGVFRPSIVPSYSAAAFSSLLPPGPSGASLASSLQGAFQPKSLVTPGQMLVPFRDREKAVPPPGLPPAQKKQGKWCAVHVRVAWEIFHRQQKQGQREADGAPGSSSSAKSGPDTKPLEPLLRPPSHLLQGGVSRPHELGPPPSSLLASVARSLPDGIAHPSSSFLTSAAQIGISPFPRPSPYPPPSLLNPLGFSGLGSSMFAPVRDMAPPPGLHTSLSSSSPHDWNRLHRAPSSFPSWPKSEAEREKERERERERELRKEEERERERRASINHRLPSTEDSRHKEPESSRPKSRSRSRSPLRNGRLDHHVKSEMGPYDRRYDDKRPLSASSSLSSSALKLKEERREEDIPPHPHHLEREKLERLERERLERDRLERDRLERDRMERDRLERERLEKEKLLQNAAVAEREKLMQAVEQREKLLHSSGYLGLHPFAAALPPAHPGLLDRRLMAPPGAAYPFLDRPPVPTSMWNPFDKSPAEIAHRLEMERERERMAMMSRLSSIPSHLAALEQERLKEQIIREQQEREYELRRQYLDRLPAFNADRLRAADPLALGGYFPRTVSPMFGPGGLAGLKSNSPHGIPGAPPPLIPSSSSSVAATMLSSRSHDNSPSSSSKSKGCSPADSTSDLKDKREGNSTDPDAHSR